ncbi:MAG: hypothetical protein M3R04_07710 [bacterium]|nr:hypothetical protein [bacterium]
MKLLKTPLTTEDPRTKLQELLRIIRHELVRDRSELAESEQRLLIAVVVAEVELGRSEPQMQRVNHALELAGAEAALEPYAARARELLESVLVD